MSDCFCVFSFIVWAFAATCKFYNTNACFTQGIDPESMMPASAGYFRWWWRKTQMWIPLQQHGDWDHSRKPRSLLCPQKAMYIGTLKTLHRKTSACEKGMTRQDHGLASDQRTPVQHWQDWHNIYSFKHLIATIETPINIWLRNTGSWRATSQALVRDGLRLQDVQLWFWFFSRFSFGWSRDVTGCGLCPCHIRQL